MYEEVVVGLDNCGDFRRALVPRHSSRALYGVGCQAIITKQLVSCIIVEPVVLSCISSEGPRCSGQPEHAPWLSIYSQIRLLEYLFEVYDSQYTTVLGFSISAAYPGLDGVHPLIRRYSLSSGEGVGR